MHLLESLEFRLHFAAQAYDWSQVVIKGNGFVTGAVFSSVQQNLIYARTDIGGAYRWDQAQGKRTPLNWFSTYNDWSTQNGGVESIALDPTNANRVYMVAGTYGGPACMLRSTDQGRTGQGTLELSGSSPIM